MEKEKTFEELAREIVRKQVNEEMLTGTDIVETATKFGAARTVRDAATEEKKTEVRNMYRKGIGVCEIARRTGFAQSTISRWVGTWQLDPAKSVKAKGNKGAKLEPAPAGTETSPKNKNSHFDNNTISEICQEALRKISSNASLHADVYAQATLDIIAKFKGGQEK